MWSTVTIELWLDGLLSLERLRRRGGKDNTTLNKAGNDPEVLRREEETRKKVRVSVEAEEKDSVTPWIPSLYCTVQYETLPSLLV